MDSHVGRKTTGRTRAKKPTVNLEHVTTPQASRAYVEHSSSDMQSIIVNY